MLAYRQCLQLQCAQASLPYPSIPPAPHHAAVVEVLERILVPGFEDGGVRAVDLQGSQAHRTVGRRPCVSSPQIPPSLVCIPCCWALFAQLAFRFFRMICTIHAICSGVVTCSGTAGTSLPLSGPCLGPTERNLPWKVPLCTCLRLSVLWPAHREEVANNLGLVLRLCRLCQPVQLAVELAHLHWVTRPAPQRKCMQCHLCCRARRCLHAWHVNILAQLTGSLAFSVRASASTSPRL